MIHTHEIAGIALDEIRLIERLDSVGGTWCTNIYPGCMSDVEGLAYLPLLERFCHGYLPSRKYIPQAEILDHAVRVAKEYDIYGRVWFDTAMTGAKWNKQDSVWTINISRQGSDTTIASQHLVLAAGRLTQPVIPQWSGLSEFQGRVIHTAEWPRDTTVTSFTRKRVAVIGTGASAVQIIPEIATVVDKLYIFQRHAPYITPRHNYEHPLSGIYDHE